MSSNAHFDEPSGRIMKSFTHLTSENERTHLLPKPEKNYWIPKRFVFSMMSFIACCIAVSFNMNISIAIVSMVNRTSSQNISTPTNSSNYTLQNFKAGKFNWDADVEGLVLGAVYYGQLVSFIPGGRMAELYGGKKMLIICTLLSSFANAVSPILAHWNVYAFVAGRIIVGMGTGQVIPIVFFMLARWIPVTERSFHASFILSGYGIGSFATVLISGALCGTDFLGGWPSVFYTGGVFGFIWCMLALFIMYETPDDHPTISCEEIAYILSDQEREKFAQIKSIPWKEMAISVPLWALSIGFFGQFWLLGFFSTVHASYMGTVLGLPIVQNGELSCLPHLLRAFATCLASYPIDIMMKKKLVSVGFVRKGATVINSVVSCAAFLGITLVGRDTTATTLLFILGGVLGEFVTFGVCMACIDIAPSLSGTVSGIVNVVGVFPFFIVPALVGWITNYEESIEKWKMVFYVTIIVTAATTLIFVIFGDLKPQKWGTAKVHKDIKENEDSAESVQKDSTTIITSNGSCT